LIATTNGLTEIEKGTYNPSGDNDNECLLPKNSNLDADISKIYPYSNRNNFGD